MRAHPDRDDGRQQEPLRAARRVRPCRGGEEREEVPGRGDREPAPQPGGDRDVADEGVEAVPSPQEDGGEEPAILAERVEREIETAISSAVSSVVTVTTCASVICAV